MNLSIHPRQRVGLVGANGCGKSSLLALLRGELEAEAGALQMPPGLRLSSVLQETPSLPQSALDYVLDGHRALRRAEALLARAGTAAELAAAHEALDDVQAYALPARAAELLHGLGFRPEQHTWPVAEFSGGWRMRLNLAQALIAPADVLLLDEPTNHLDLDALIWLQQELKQRPETQIIIAHDRDFLDALCTHIIYLEQTQARLYSGHYSDFERQHQAQRQQQEALFKQEQRRRAHLEDFVRRFRAKASKAKQAQSRLKALEKLQAAPPSPLPSAYALRLPSAEAQPSPLFQAENAVLGYGERILLQKFKLRIQAGERIGLLGRNGAGKSTLMKALAGELAPLAGEMNWHPQCKIAYFTQHQLDALEPSKSALWHWQQLCPQQREQEGRNFLGGYGFSGERADVPVAPFSGGEKARLALALLAAQAPNLLLLDEPTNHLDLQMRDALTEALQDYAGALVLISHDRHLLRHSCDAFYWVEGGQLREFNGDLEDYQRALLQSETAAAPASSPPPARQQKRREAERRDFLRPFKKALQQAERQHQALQDELQALQQQLADEALYQRPQDLQEVLRRETAIKQALPAAEALWFEALAALEEAEQQP